MPSTQKKYVKKRGTKSVLFTHHYCAKALKYIASCTAVSSVMHFKESTFIIHCYYPNSSEYDIVFDKPADAKRFFNYLNE